MPASFYKNTPVVVLLSNFICAEVRVRVRKSGEIQKAEKKKKNRRADRGEVRMLRKKKMEVKTPGKREKYPVTMEYYIQNEHIPLE